MIRDQVSNANYFCISNMYIHMTLQDYMDIGYGYDSEDSFVDDSEAVCECIVC